MAGKVFKNYTGQPLRYGGGEFPTEGFIKTGGFKMIAEFGHDGNVLPICTTDGTVVGLPAQEQDVFLLVTAEVALAAKLSGRTTADLLVPVTPSGFGGVCTMLVACSEKDFYCNQSKNCTAVCKYGRKNCFGQGENVHFKINEETEKSHFVIKDSNT